ncbi:MAG: DNA primase [Kiritimatiellia bacterium]|jgi:DNA primase
MARISDQVLEEIRQRIDIVELIGSRMSLKRAGSSYKACCPFHNEKTPSFHVNPARQTFHCFGCGAHGNLFDFVMRSDGLPFPEAVRRLAEKAGVKVDTETDFDAMARAKLYEVHSELAAFYQRCLAQTAEAKIARDYLDSRALDETVRRDFGIGYAPNARNALVRWGEKHGYDPETLVSAGLLAPPNQPGRDDDYFDRFRGRLMFPIRDTQGRVVAFSGRLLRDRKNTGKYVNSPETPIFRKSRTLYALDKARASILKDVRREAILCEGQIDVIRCHACGFPTAVAAQGTAFTVEHAEILKRSADSVTLVFDGDGAGINAAIRTGAILLEQDLPVRVAALPPGEDPDSFLRTRGPAAFRDALDAAVSLTTFQIRALRARETDPDAVNVLSRIARSALDLIAGCSTAVLRSSLLQNAADELHLPVSALEEDLESLRAERARYAGRKARFPDGSARAKPVAIAPIRASAVQDIRGDAPPEIPEEEDAPPFSDDPIPFDLPFSDDVIQPREDDFPASRPPAPPRPKPIPKAAYGICELLMHHESAEAPATILQSYLPLDLIDHPDARAVVAAALETRLTGVDRLAELAASATGSLAGLVAALVRSESRVMRAQESTPEEAMQDLVVRIWADELSAERDRIDAQPATPENDIRRLELTMRIKTLQRPDARWPAREKVLRAEIERRGLIPPPQADVPVEKNPTTVPDTPSSAAAGAVSPPLPPGIFSAIPSESPPEEDFAGSDLPDFV